MVEQIYLSRMVSDEAFYSMQLFENCTKVTQKYLTVSYSNLHNPMCTYMYIYTALLLGNDSRRKFYKKKDGGRGRECF